MDKPKSSKKHYRTELDLESYIALQDQVDLWNGRRNLELARRSGVDADGYDLKGS